MDFIQHVIKDTEEIKTVIETATIKIEKRMNVLGKMLIKAQSLSHQLKPISQTAIQAASRGHTLTHSKSYYFWANEHRRRLASIN